MTYTFSSPPCGGTVHIPPSKSELHRLLILAAVGAFPVRVSPFCDSEDIEATVRCLTALGAKFARLGDGWNVTPMSNEQWEAGASPLILDCGASGATLRFMIPLCAALGVNASFVRREKLGSRPLGPLADALAPHGVTLRETAGVLTVSGRLNAGDCTVDGSVSSQFVSGLLLALTRVRGTSRLTRTGAAVSSEYVTMTADAIRMFGGTVDVLPDAGGNTVYTVRRGLRPPESVTAGGDWSSAAVWLAAGALGGAPMTVTGLRGDSRQADRRIADFLRAMGGKVTVSPAAGGTVSVTAYPSDLVGIRADLTDCPDLAPILAVLGAGAAGETVLMGTERLKVKECDREAAIAEQLTLCGYTVTKGADCLRIRGREREQLAPPVLPSHRDHRMVFSAFLLSLLCGAVTVMDAECVAKSYKGFFEELEMRNYAPRVR